MKVTLGARELVEGNVSGIRIRDKRLELCYRRVGDEV
jgi:hypothetical protein